MANERPLLDYALPEPGRWRVRIRRVLLAAGWIAAVVVILFGAWWAGSALQLSIRVRAKVERLGRYEAPPDRVVYDDDRGRMEDLLRRPHYDHFPGAFNHETPRRYAYYDDLGGGGVNIGVNRRGHAVLFLHQLRDANGRTEVVEVFLDPWDTLSTWDDEAARRVWVLGAGLARATGRGEMMGHENYVTFEDVLPFQMNDLRPMRIFAGQLDPLDASRFTIRYELGETQGTIEGQLATDGYVRLQHRPDGG